MIKLRVLPLAMAGTGLLLTFKVISLVTAGGLMLDHVPAPANIALSTPEETDLAYRPVAFAQESADISNDDIVTGSTEPSEKDAPAKVETPPAPPPMSAGISLPVNPPEKPLSPAERELLEKLQQRREELEARNREMDVREGLLKAMEIKIEERVSQLKDMENQIMSSAPAEEQAKAAQEAAKAKLKDLVIMYEAMKPKEAARIFDQLEMKVLVSVVMEMNPRKSSEIIAKMTPASAQKLTVALASQPTKTVEVSADNLPKINGQP
jgi:flagellar motility protein MotE (MotC chaperone)